MRITFGQWLKLARDNVGASQKQLAEELGVKIQTVGNWEAGRSVPRLTLAQASKFCSYLNVSLNDAAKAFEGNENANR